MAASASCWSSPRLGKLTVSGQHSGAEGGGMPSMSSVEQALCRSGPWRLMARRVMLPWVLQGVPLRGDVLEIGAGSGATAAGLLDMAPNLRMTVTDYDDDMV